VQGDEDVVKRLAPFEPVEWLYDGLKGRIIPWTLENGGTSKDPSILAFVVGSDGAVFAKCPSGSTYRAGAFAKWLEEQAAAFEKEHPRTLVPFVRAGVEMVEKDGEMRPSCHALPAAIRTGRPVLVYVGRDRADEKDRAGRREVKACRAFERKHFGSERNAEAAEGWTCLRFDLADEAHRKFVEGMGFDSAPTVLVFRDGSPEPLDLTKKLRSGSLAYQLEKLGPKKD
jgi:hypothetical protein